MKTGKIFSILIIFLGISLSTFSQNIQNLQKEKERLEKEINFTRNKIAELQNKRSLSLNELETLQKQISIRQELIRNISQQLDVINVNIKSTEAIITSLEKDIEKLKSEYAKMIYHSYISQNKYNSLLFVFSADNFNDAYNRVKYLKEYSSFRKQQADLIRKTQQSLAKEIAEFEQQKKQQQELLAAESNHSKILNKEKNEISGKISEFRQQENRFVADIRKKEKETAKINQQIERLIREAREKAEREARERAAAEAKARQAKSESGTAAPAPTTTASAAPAPSLTPEARALSNSFAANRAQLPWPVERGTIIRGFGKKPHAVLKGIETVNNGIDISTTENADIRAIFDGEVTSIFYSPVFHYGVMIMHGEYFTVYLNLKEVSVKENEKVKTKQKIGTIYTNQSNGTSELQFQLWKGSTVLNPSLWLYN